MQKLLFIVIHIPFFFNAPTGQTPYEIFTRDSSNDATLRKGQTF